MPTVGFAPVRPCGRSMPARRHAPQPPPITPTSPATPLSRSNISRRPSPADDARPRNHDRSALAAAPADAASCATSRLTAHHERTNRCRRRPQPIVVCRPCRRAGGPAPPILQRGRAACSRPGLFTDAGIIVQRVPAADSQATGTEATSTALLRSGRDEDAALAPPIAPRVDRQSGQQERKRGERCQKADLCCSRIKRGPGQDGQRDESDASARLAGGIGEKQRAEVHVGEHAAPEPPAARTPRGSHSSLSQ